MPKSKNRKGHKEKSADRKKNILRIKAERKAQFTKWVKAQQEAQEINNQPPVWPPRD